MGLYLRLPLIAFSSHFLFASFLHFIFGVSIRDTLFFKVMIDPWSQLWHTIPLEILMERPFESLWYLHSQPPVFNAYGGLLYGVFQEHFFDALFWFNVLFGSLTCAMIPRIGHALSLPKLVTGLITFIFVVSPGLTIYEAFQGYCIISLFLITLTVYLLALYYHTGSSNILTCFCMAVLFLIFYRTLYHLVYFAPVILIVLFARSLSKKQLCIIFLVFLLPFGWYTKNYVMYGFFGSSSWFGGNLWRIVRYEHYPDLQHMPKKRKKRLEAIMSKSAFDYPVEFRALGYTKSTDIAVLNQNDRHNINVIRISKDFGRVAKYSMYYHFDAYWENVKRAFFLYCTPSYRFEPVIANLEKIPKFIVAGWDTLLWLTQSQERFESKEIHYSALFALSLAICLFGFCARCLRRTISLACRRSFKENSFLPDYVLYLVVYSASVGILFELGENSRFKFTIEPLILLGAIFVLKETWLLLALANKKRFAHQIKSEENTLHLSK